MMGSQQSFVKSNGQAVRLMERFEQLRAGRTPHEAHWQELARYCHPSRQIPSSQSPTGTGAGTGGGTLAHGTKAMLFDSTAALSADALASGLFALLTNPALDWFELEETPDLPEVKRIAQAVSGALEDRRNGLYGVLPDLYRDLVTFGTAVLSVEADGSVRTGSGIRFAVRSLDEMLFAANEAGQIDTAFRAFSLSAEQCVERYGTQAPKAAVDAVANNHPDQRVEMVHAVQPRADYDPHAVGAKAMAYTSLVIDRHDRTLVHAGGYQEFPYLVVRWSLAGGGGQIYGESPASLALADIRALNAMVRTNLTAAQKAVDPPLMAVDDNGLRGIKTHPGAVIFGGLDLNGKRLVEPLPSGGVGAVNLGLALEEQRRASIREAFHLGLLREVAERAQQTATEFLGRQEERLRLLAPNLGRIEAELLYPLVQRVAAILARSGKITVQPDRLQVRFLSPLAQAQRAAEAHRLTRSIKALEPFARAVPSVMERLDTETLSRDLLDYAGLPMREVDAAGAHPGDPGSTMPQGGIL